MGVLGEELPQMQILHGLVVIFERMPCEALCQGIGNGGSHGGGLSLLVLFFLIHRHARNT